MKKKELASLLFGPKKKETWTRQEQVAARPPKTVLGSVYHVILGSAESGAEYHFRILANKRKDALETARELCIWLAKGEHLNPKRHDYLYPLDMPGYLVKDPRMIDQWVRFFPQNISIKDVVLETELIR